MLGRASRHLPVSTRAHYPGPKAARFEPFRTSCTCNATRFKLLHAGESPYGRQEMSLDRRSFNKALLAAASASFLPVLPAWAQELKSLKIIAPAGPGGGYDQLA